MCSVNEDEIPHRTINIMMQSHKKNQVVLDRIIKVFLLKNDIFADIGRQFKKLLPR